MEWLLDIFEQLFRTLCLVLFTGPVLNAPFPVVENVRLGRRLAVLPFVGASTTLGTVVAGVRQPFG